jgi:hypothetical protein
MSNEMSLRIRHIVSGLAAEATTALLISMLVGAFDTRLLRDQSASRAVSAVTLAVSRPTVIRRI